MEYRLKRAKEAMPNIECINFKERPIYDQVREKLPHGAPPLIHLGRAFLQPHLRLRDALCANHGA